MSIANRISLIIHTHHHTNSTFADTIGVQRSNVSHVLSGRNKPSLDFLEKVVQHFPRVDAHWLLTGENKKEEQGQSTTVQQETKSEPIQEAAIHTTEKANSKIIQRIAVFYTDGTFDSFLPNEL